MNVPARGKFTRRRFISNAAALAAIPFLTEAKNTAAEPPPEITTIRLEEFPAICIAPQYVAEALLYAEGFTRVEYPENPANTLLPPGQNDMGMVGAPILVADLDVGSGGRQRRPDRAVRRRDAQPRSGRHLADGGRAARRPVRRQRAARRQRRPREAGSRMVARPEGLSTVSETPDDKSELLVRSVLTAVDMRLGEVRHEMHAVAAESEQRHRQVLQYMRDLEHRLERRSDDASPLSGTGDSLAQRMEEATQAMLERIDELHQRNTVATNERFALINNTLEQLGGIASASSTGSISPSTCPALTWSPTCTSRRLTRPANVGPIL